MTEVNPETRRVDALVVGAGFTGIYATHLLREHGFEVLSVDAAEDFGGTWYWNRYPGARCDVESFDYSFGFSEELQQTWSWTERYATQPEIQRYLAFAADFLDLRSTYRFGESVTAMRWDDSAGKWHFEFGSGLRVEAKYAIMGTGPLSAPLVPSFVGLEGFKGTVLHTANWPDEGFDFGTKRVAVIGTGSSGVQAIPLIAEESESVVVFQRTPNFVAPAQNRLVDSGEMDRVKETYQARRKMARNMSSGYLKDNGTRNAADITREDRRIEYQRRWDEGGPTITSSFADLKTNMDSNKTLADFFADKIRDIVRDPETARKLTPTTYPVGAKRICVGTNYYETYNRSNVTLVDVNEEKLIEITPAGVRTHAKEYPIDVLVLATGFDAMTGALSRIDITGRQGRTLKETWESGPVTYLGMMIPGFPNFFTFVGAGSPSVLANVVAGAEQQVEWVADLLTHARAANAERIEPNTEAATAWVETVNKTAEGTMFFRAKSWYLGANVPGKPRVFMPYAGGFPNYRSICDRVRDENYRGLEIR